MHVDNTRPVVGRQPGRLSSSLGEKDPRQDKNPRRWFVARQLDQHRREKRP